MLATYVGAPRYNDQLPDFGSAEYRQQSHAFTERWLERIEAIGTTGLTDQELLSYQIFVRDAKNSLEGIRIIIMRSPALAGAGSAAPAG